MKDAKLREFLGVDDFDEEGTPLRTFSGELDCLRDEITECYKIIDKLADKMGYERILISAKPAEMTFVKKSTPTPKKD